MTKRTAKSFEPRTDILPRAQGRLWPRLGQTPPQFTLYGGTALALRLAHRKSADFDFFSTESFDADALVSRVGYLKGARLRQAEPNTLVCSVKTSGVVSVSYFGGLAIGQVDPHEVARGPEIFVASLRDIAGTKVAVVTKRAEAKDYFDVHALMTLARVPLAEMLSCGKAIYGRGFDPFLSLKALAYHDDLVTGALSQGLRRDLIAAVRATDPRRLPAIKAIKRRTR